MQKRQKPNKPGQQVPSPALKRVRKSVYKQALLAGMLIVLTVVVLFAMTAAWYTNIVQTSGLVFEASTWGFDGTVTLGGDSIAAAPGDEGVVELTATSNSDELTAVSLNVSRAQMSAAMQQRIFFYVDTSKTINSETVDRVYLSSTDSYSYLLFSEQILLLTEEVHNDALLKWHWVYDVLGYYVQGTMTQSTTTTTGTDGTVTSETSYSMGISEYLRPIEYDYDEAKTTFVDGNGALLTIDGSKTVNTFLAEVSGSDGYAGTIDVTQAVTTSDGRIYYPVSVDSTGYGVWAYLCTYSEIVENNIYDTYLGSVAGTTDAGTYPATLTISAQNTKVQATQVSTATALTTEIAKALTTGEKAIIQLGGNVTLEDELVIGSTTAAQQVMLDLNEYTLTVPSGTYSTDGAAIQVASGSALTLSNGTLACTSSDSYAIDGTGAAVTLSDVTISGVKRAIVVKDNATSNTTNSDALIRLVGCTIDTTDVSVMVSGNGDASEQNTQLIVEDCSITSGYMGITFNGSSDQGGVDAQILNSDVYGKWAGVYLPQNDAKLTISESEISGYTGLVIKGGVVSVIDSTVEGTGAATTPDESTLSLSGFTDTGDGIYIESNYVQYYGYTVKLTLDASKVTSKYAMAVRVYPEVTGVSVTVESGTFSTEPQSGWLVSGAECTEVADSSGTVYYWVEVPAEDLATETTTTESGVTSTDTGNDTGSGEEQSDSGTT